MIPSSIHGAAVDAFVPVINRVGDAVVGFDLRKLVPSFLDYPADVVLDAGLLTALAWQYDVDVDGLEQGEAVAVIKGAIALHRRGGTPWAIKRSLEIRGFDAVSISEGFLASVLHDGTWVHDGSHNHGGIYSNWSDFSVSLFGRSGFDGPVVLREINRRKSARSRLTGVSVTLVYAMLLQAPIYRMVLVCIESEVEVVYDIDPYTLIFLLGSEYDARVVIGIKGYDSLGVVVGETVFPTAILKGGYAVTIRLSLDLSEFFSFDDSVDFDSSSTNF